MRYFAVVNEGDNVVVLASLETGSAASAKAKFKAFFKAGTSKPFTEEEYRALVDSLPTLDTETDEYEQLHFGLNEDTGRYDALGSFVSREEAWAHANLQNHNYTMVINGLEAAAAGGDFRYVLTQPPMRYTPGQPLR